jgi:hypothetical protein
MSLEHPATNQAFYFPGDQALGGFGRVLPIQTSLNELLKVSLDERSGAQAKAASINLVGALGHHPNIR